MTFCLHQGGLVKSSQITHSQPSNVHPLAHILDTCALVSVIAPFSQFAPTASRPSPGEKPPKQRRAVRKNTGTKKKLAA